MRRLVPHFLRLRWLFGLGLPVGVLWLCTAHADVAVQTGGAGFCTTCHGVDREVDQGAPGLCGAEAAWIAARLQAYQREGASVMTRLGHGLTISDIEALSWDAARLYADDGPFCQALRDD
ncbi:c-type cytochrome [Algiphilus sp.]|uniref:c-type cytochrome n=1 Tax=Algiphilus sp. TaxID=1872431 RepID=UPI003B52EB71